MDEFTAHQADAAEQPGTRRLMITGGMTIQHGPELKAALLQAMAGASGVILDLREVTEVDLSGLQHICAAHRLSIVQQLRFTVCREGNRAIEAVAAAAGFPRHTGCAHDTEHTCVWAAGGK